MSKTKNETLNFNIIQESLELDTDIYIKLSGILINEVIKTIPEPISPNLNFSKIFKNFTNDSTAQEDEIKNETNKKLPILIKLFEIVNRERVALRDTLIKLIKKKFWKLKQEKKNANFYINKFKGLNTQILKTRIFSLEEKIKQKNIKIAQTENTLQKIKNTNNLHLQTIKKQTNYLKDSILNGSIISADHLNINQNQNSINKSINNITNFNSNESVKSNKVKRKIRRRNSTHNFSEMKIEKKVKESRFKDNRRVKRSFLDREEDYNVYESHSSSGEEGRGNEVFRHRKTFR